MMVTRTLPASLTTSGNPRKISLAVSSASAAPYNFTARSYDYSVAYRALFLKN
jgi:hypothetical protein